MIASLRVFTHKNPKPLELGDRGFPVIKSQYVIQGFAEKYSYIDP